MKRTLGTPKKSPTKTSGTPRDGAKARRRSSIESSELPAATREAAGALERFRVDTARVDTAPPPPARNDGATLAPAIVPLALMPPAPPLGLALLAPAAREVVPGTGFALGTPASFVPPPPPPPPARQPAIPVKPCEVRRVGDKKWRRFASRTDALAAFPGLRTLRVIGKLINDNPRKKTNERAPPDIRERFEARFVGGARRGESAPRRPRSPPVSAAALAAAARGPPVSGVVDRQPPPPPLLTRVVANVNVDLTKPQPGDAPRTLKYRTALSRVLRLDAEIKAGRGPSNVATTLNAITKDLTSPCGRPMGRNGAYLKNKYQTKKPKKRETELPSLNTTEWRVALLRELTSLLEPKQRAVDVERERALAKETKRVAAADAAALKDRTARVAQFDSGDQKAAIKSLGKAVAALLRDPKRLTRENANVLAEEVVYYADQGCYGLATCHGFARDRVEFMGNKIQEYLAKPAPKVEAARLVASASAFIHRDDDHSQLSRRGVFSEMTGARPPSTQRPRIAPRFAVDPLAGAPRP